MSTVAIVIDKIVVTSFNKIYPFYRIFFIDTKATDALIDYSLNKFYYRLTIYNFLIQTSNANRINSGC